MVENGLIEEVEFLMSKYDKHIKRFQKTIGYKEVVDFLDGVISKDEMISKIQQNSRRFAKRQLTWWRGREDVNWVKIV